MLLRQCPITHGLPTRMTEQGFHRLCQRRYQEAKVVRNTQGERTGSRENTYCVDECGQRWPDELTIVTLEDMTMATKKTRQCSDCQRTLTIRSHGRCHVCWKKWRAAVEGQANTQVSIQSAALNNIDYPQARSTEITTTTRASESAVVGSWVGDAMVDLGEQVREAMAILQADLDIDTLADVCRRRMNLIGDLEKLITEQQSEVRALRRQVQELSTELDELEEATTAAKQTAFPRDSMAYYIDQACYMMRELLLAKNTAYGNSAAEPVRIFSSSGPLEQINVRIDDKLSRLIKGKEYPGDNDEIDLTGYLLLKIAVKNWLAMEVAQRMEAGK